MPDGTYTFRVDEELKTAFIEVAAAQERTAAQLLRVLMRSAVQRWQDAQEHDAWVRREVALAVAEADDPTRASHARGRAHELARSASGARSVTPSKPP